MSQSQLGAPNESAHRVESGGQPASRRLDRGSLMRFERVTLKQSRTFLQPDVTLLRAGEERYVLRDFAPRNALVRATWGRFLIARESAAYQRLAGVPGIPRLIARIDDHALVVEYVDAKPLPHTRHAGFLHPQFFPNLVSTVAQMHARGVAHGDLRRRNILQTDGGMAILIDFESAWFDGSGRVRHAIFRMMRRIDDLTVLKIRHKYFPRETSGEELARLERPPLLLRVGRFLRKRIYHPLSPKIMRRRIQRWFGREHPSE